MRVNLSAVQFKSIIERCVEQVRQVHSHQAKLHSLHDTSLSKAEPRICGLRF